MAADEYFHAFISGAAVDTIGGSEKLPVVESGSTKHVTPALLAAYAIDQLHGAGVITTLTGTHQLSVFTSGDDEKIITFANLSAWIIDEIEGVATAASATSDDTILIVDGGVLKQIDVDDLASYINSDVLDLTALGAATPGASDLFLFGSGATPKKITLTNLEVKLWSDFATYVDGLTENTVVTATDKFYCLQSGTPKWADPDALATYLSIPDGDVTGPVTTTENNIPQWSATTKDLKDGLTLVTTVRATGSALDTAVSTEQAVREAIGVVADLDIDGATDIGGDLADVDLFIVDDGASGANRKSAISRLWTYITSKIQGLTAKTAPVSADILTIQDSEASNALKELTITNLMVALDIDGMTDIGAVLADADEIIVDDGGVGTNRRCDVSRIYDYIEDKIQAQDNKATPVNADILMIQDSEDSNELKELTCLNLKTFVDPTGTDPTFVHFTNDADRAASPPANEEQLGHQIDTNRVYAADQTGDVDSAVYNSKFFALTQTTGPCGIGFNSDGSKMYILDNGDDDVHQYSLSTPWDVNTASYDSVSHDCTSEDSAARSMAFNIVGTAMYILGFNTDTVYQYTLSSAWDLSTASYASKSKIVTTEETSPTGLAFSTDGTKMYVVGQANDTVYQYTLSTPWDVSTASYATKSLSVNSEDGTPEDIAFSSDGTKLFMLGAANDTVFQYTLSTPWDVSTGSYASKSFSINSEEASPLGMLVVNDTRLYVCGSSEDDIFQYSMGFEWVELGGIWQLATTAGTGITGAAASYTAGVEKVGTYFKTTIVIDLAGLRGTAANDIIGDDGTANACHIGQITAARNGTIFAGKIECLETPAGSDPDIDLYSATEATGVEDQAITALTETQLINSGSHAANAFKSLTAFPAADEYLYLVAGTGVDADYTAGILVITLWGK